MNYNLKQLFIRKKDGKLILKPEEYKSSHGFTFIQDHSDGEWLINHNMNSKSFLYNVFIDNFEVQASITIIDENNIKVNLSNGIIGQANFLFFK